ncbi:AT-rich interactive domain-containing protein 5B [Portunus trituberculatus]|uniref:AT-rich interactive domain-containing protein 5B n=1 Tax=Portunus trituberculatus TaxID=210409 RepID=A0A5B7FKJ9_PORTR|nr:AT-rich interactive domain-containing protein 5B [Portunus trituberculatus]
MQSRSVLGCFVGAPCGHHGNYTFYKAFKYNLHGNPKILSLGEFFFIKIWEDEEIISIGEAQLLWEDRTSGQILVSLRIYFLPENTPEGRCEEHGEVSTTSITPTPDSAWGVRGGQPLGR